MPARLRQDERDALHARIVQVMQADPDLTTNMLAMRFGMPGYAIRAIVKRLGLKPSQKECLSLAKDKRFNLPSNVYTVWGYNSANLTKTASKSIKST